MAKEGKGLRGLAALGIDTSKGVTQGIELLKKQLSGTDEVFKEKRTLTFDIDARGISSEEFNSYVSAIDKLSEIEQQISQLDASVSKAEFDTLLAQKFENARIKTEIEVYALSKSLSVCLMLLS